MEPTKVTGSDLLQLSEGQYSGRLLTANAKVSIFTLFLTRK